MYISNEHNIIKQNIYETKFSVITVNDYGKKTIS